MPLNKTPGAAAVATPATPAATPAASPAAPATPAKRSLKAKAAVTPAPTPAATEAVDQDAVALQPADMKPEQKRIQRSGIWQAVVQSNALVQYAPTLEAFLDLVDKAADRGLQYVNRQ